MGQIAVTKPVPTTKLRDLIELGKPRLSSLVLFTAATGIFAAPSVPSLWRAAVFVGATALLVIAANTLNCWIEREIDALMKRTQSRPLPAGRLEPRVALISGSVLTVVSLALLFWSTNPLTTLLGFIALVSYAAVYTPLKRVTPWSVLVGSVPGALPPLMGWTAATNSLDLPGWFLFGVLFFWQLPHFIAISVYLKDDFERGGLRVMSVVYSPRAVKIWTFVFTVMMLGWSLIPQPLGLSGTAYTVIAALLGLGFCVVAAVSNARRVFGYSLIYLPLIILAYLLL